MQSNTDAAQCMHWFLYSTTGINWLVGWSSAAPRRHAGEMSVAPVAVVARPAKRQRLEADRRRDVLRVVGNQFADIDFTRYQYLPEAGTAGPGRGRIVPVKPVPTALVENWRHLESYECDGDTSYSEDQFTMLQMRSGHHRRHYTGPFGCTVQSNVPGPRELLCNAARPVQGRSALQKLRKQLGTMCMRLAVDHFRVRGPH